MVLRNGKDTQDYTSNGMTLADLKGDKTDAAADPFAAPGMQNVAETTPTTMPSASAKTSWTIQIIKGGTTSTQTLDVPAKPAPIEPAKAPTAVSNTDDQLQ